MTVTTEKPKKQREVAPVGALIRDADDSGIVVGGFQGAVGERLYIYLNADGRIGSQYESSIEFAPVLRGGLPAVTDLSGRDPLAAHRHTAPPPPVAGHALMMALNNRIDHLRPLVAANAKAGSELAQAFAALGDSDDGPRTFDSEAALAAWETVPAKEQQRILNGWAPTPEIKTLAEVLHEAAQYTGDIAEFAMSVRCGPSSGASIGAGWRPFASAHPVELIIRQGTSKQDAVAAVERALVILEQRWHEAVGLDESGCLTFDEEPPAPRGQVKLVRRRSHGKSKI